VFEFNIFVSSTFEDLKTHRKVVRDLITELDFRDIAMERFPATDRPPVEKIRPAIAESDVYLGIFAWRYGSCLPGSNLSYTEFEYQLAEELGKPRLIFLADPTEPVLPAFVEKGPNGESIDRFRAKIQEDSTITWKYFKNERDLEHEVFKSLIQLFRLSPRYGKLASKDAVLLDLRLITQEDLAARRNEIDNNGNESGRRWFIPTIGRCTVGRNFIPRTTIRQSVADWLLQDETPYLFLVGPSGIGKTNFLVDLIDLVARKKPSMHQRTALMISLGTYDPGCAFPGNLQAVLRDQPRLVKGTEAVLSRVNDGEIVLILDGLDEFARNHGEELCRSLFIELEQCLDLGHARVVVSCRDHIYRRLGRRGFLPKREMYQHVEVQLLSANQVKAAVEKRLGTDSVAYLALSANEALLRFAENPLLLEMMCTISREGWKRIKDSQTPGRLYDVWFEEIIATSADPQNILEDELISDTNIKVGRIAGLMLESKSDLISESALEAAGISLRSLQALTRTPFGVFVKETRDEWGFVHSSFREFALARAVATELKSRDYYLLARTSNFDYVGAETYQFLRDIISADEQLLEHLEAAMRNTEQDETAWNNVAHNGFEAVGMIGEDSAERFFDTAIRILNLGPDAPSSASPRASYRTMYNIVRCLERLHKSAPRPYCRHVLQQDWSRPQTPSWGCFGAVAIRGFHLATQRPGPYPPMIYQATSDNPKQKDLSGCLLSILESLNEHKQPRSEHGTSAPCAVAVEGETKLLGGDATYLEINCTYALIRWLHEDHVNRAKSLLGRAALVPDSKANLFQALLRFKKPEILQGCAALFEGMILHWSYVDETMLPADFTFRNVTLRDCKLDVIPKRLENCTHQRRQASTL
jgi:hypothetical protein